MTQVTSNNILEQCAEHALKHLAVSEWKPEDPPTAAEKRKAKYEVGRACLRAREEFTSDNEFGEWRRYNIIEKCGTNVSTETLRRYALLPQFGSEKDCETVKHSNVYKLMQSGNEDILEEVKQILIDFPVPRLAKPEIDAVMKGKTRPSQITNEERAQRFVDTMAMVTSKVNFRNNLLEITGLGTSSTPQEIRKTRKMLLSKAHPDKGGDAVIFNIVKNHFDKLESLLDKESD